jgi:hypothetical protein
LAVVVLLGGVVVGEEVGGWKREDGSWMAGLDLECLWGGVIGGVAWEEEREEVREGGCEK